MYDFLVPWLATTVTATYHYLPWFKGATEYPCQVERHKVGKRGKRRREQRREQQGRAGRGRTRTGVAKGESGASGEGSGGWGEKRNPLVVDVLMYWASYGGLVPIRFCTYNICNRRNGGL